MKLVAGRRYGVRHALKKKARVRSMRVSGMSVPALAKQFGLSKCTVSLWVRDLRLAPGRAEEMMAAGRKKSARLSKQNAASRAERWRSEAAAAWPKLSRDGQFMLGVGLYWGEGTKSSRCLSLSNSDPMIVRSWRAWVGKYAPNVKLRARVNAHGDVDFSRAAKYWARISGVKDVRVYRAVSSASKGRMPRRRLPYGTMTLTVCSGGTEWHTKMMMWLSLAGKM